jgi:hypothetical protein
MIHFAYRGVSLFASSQLFCMLMCWNKWVECFSPLLFTLEYKFTSVTLMSLGKCSSNWLREQFCNVSLHVLCILSVQ